MIEPQALIPMVIEKSGQLERAYDIYSLLLKIKIFLLALLSLPKHLVYHQYKNQC